MVTAQQIHHLSHRVIHLPWVSVGLFNVEHFLAEGFELSILSQPLFVLGFQFVQKVYFLPSSICEDTRDVEGVDVRVYLEFRGEDSNYLNLDAVSQG